MEVLQAKMRNRRKGLLQISSISSRDGIGKSYHDELCLSYELQQSFESSLSAAVYTDQSVVSVNCSSSCYNTTQVIYKPSFL